MAANCKNTASLPVLCWQDNWTPDIDQKKAPPEPGLDKPPQSRGDKCAESIGNTLFHSCPISSHTWLTSFSTGTIASHWRTTSFMFPVFNTLVKACAVMNMRALLSI